MQNIGDRLAEARKRLGIALREASEATKIRTDYLQSMESGTFDFSLPEIYKVGFLKIYARYLKLDADKLASDFLTQFSGKSPAERQSLGGMEAPVGLAPAHGSAAREAPADYVASRAQNQAALIRLGVFLGIAAIILVLLIIGLQKLLDNASSADITNKPANTPPAATAPAPAAATTVPTPPAVIAPATPSALKLVFKASNDIASLQVWQDAGHVLLFNGPLKKNNSISKTSSGPVEVKVNQVEYLTIQVNGGAAQGVADQNTHLPLKGQLDFLWP